jgi:aspartyl/asparaginyl beta-hydroxylase (cupin superfamily)
MTLTGNNAQQNRQRGLAAMQTGDFKSAIKFFTAAAESEPGILAHWLNLAMAARAAKKTDLALNAVQQVLSRQPRDLLALLLKGMVLEDLGHRADAHLAYDAAILVAPPLDKLDRNMQMALARAKSAHAAYTNEREAALLASLAPARDRADRLDRFDQAMAQYLKKKQVYHRNPHVLDFPGLPETQFYRRQDFPWLAAIEAGTDDIRAECLAALGAEEAGCSPYIQYPDGVPLDQWAELNHSPRWNAFHLLKSGVWIDENCAACPKTLAALAHVPGADLPGRGPNIMFSVLKPRTRIPPHTGVANTRLVVHIPLIIPPGCGFRVGNDTRPWVPGEAFVFDDTIEHEAWNDSDQVRIVLIFDIWHPDMTADERALVRGLFAADDQFAASIR